MVDRFFWENIKKEASRLKIPVNKERALIREYIQTRIICELYKNQKSGSFSFMGGTSMRLLRGLDRFSEDLDFDNLNNLSFSEIEEMFENVSKVLEREGLENEYNLKEVKKGAGIGELKFPLILNNLNISSNSKEKLNIKINYMTPKANIKTETIVFARFGGVQNVVTNKMGCLMSQKINAILGRKDPQPRDFYDLVWFFSQNVDPERSLFKKNNNETKNSLLEIYSKKVASNISNYKDRLRPFLINENNVSYLEMFESLVESKL